MDDGSGRSRRARSFAGRRTSRSGDKVPLALPGARLPGDVTIKVGKLRGVESEGMLCSAKELRLADDAEGLLILSPDAPVGAPIGELFPPDTIFDLEITPNRSDLLSHVGLAREVAALCAAQTLRDPVDAWKRPSAATRWRDLPVMVAANAREACPFYSARVIEGVQSAPAPDWLRGRLEAVGVRSINNVVDVTNFVMLELGQPLHAFDAAHVGPGGHRRAAGDVRARNCWPSTAAPTNSRRTISSSPGRTTAASAEGLAGVMGGEESGVTARDANASSWKARTSPRRASGAPRANSA